MKVTAYLQRKGQMINSKVLAVLALRVAVDPFKTVKKMVKDLVVKLMEEATEEAVKETDVKHQTSTKSQTQREHYEYHKTEKREEFSAAREYYEELKRGEGDRREAQDHQETDGVRPGFLPWLGMSRT